MKKLLISSAVLGLLVVTPVMADTNITATVKSEVEAKRTELKDAQERLRATAEKARGEATTTRKEIKDMREDFRVDVAKTRATVAGKVFNATITRFEKLTARIESRLAKLDASGANTADAKAFIATAKGNIADAKAQIALMQSVDLSVTSTTTARTNFDKVKTEAKAARDLLTQAKQNLQKAINAIATWESQHKAGATTTTSAEIH